MSQKRVDPIARLWHWVLLIFGAAILLTLTVSLLSKILVWLFVIAGLVLAVLVIVRLSNRSGR